MYRLFVLTPYAIRLLMRDVVQLRALDLFEHTLFRASAESAPLGLYLLLLALLPTPRRPTSASAPVIDSSLPRAFKLQGTMALTPKRALPSLRARFSVALHLVQVHTWPIVRITVQAEPRSSCLHVRYARLLPRLSPNTMIDRSSSASGSLDAISVTK